MALSLLRPSSTPCHPHCRQGSSSPEILLQLRPPLSLKVHLSSPLRPWHQLFRTARSDFAISCFRPKTAEINISGLPAMCAVAAGEVVSDGSTSLFGTHPCPHLAPPWPEPPATSLGSPRFNLSDAGTVPTKIPGVIALIICLIWLMIAQ